MKYLALLLCLAAPAFADDDAPLGGLLAKPNKQALPPLTLSAGEPLTDAPWVLKSGIFYEFEITADGSQELGLVGPEFFRAIWVDQISIEGIEVRPLGLDGVEFDEAGTMEIGFVAIKPGQYSLHVPNTKGDLQRLDITIE